MSDNEFVERRRSIAAGLESRKIDALLVAAPPNVRYLSGFTGDNGNLLIYSGGAILFTDPRFAIQAAQQVSCRIKISSHMWAPASISPLSRM